MLVALALAVATWGGGFDVLYALQDVEFDRSQRLLLAAGRARRAARAARSRARCTSATVVCLALVGAGDVCRHARRTRSTRSASRSRRAAVYEHSLVRPDDFSRLDAAFFTMNGVISIAFFVFVLAERLVHRSRRRCTRSLHLRG